MRKLRVGVDVDQAVVDAADGWLGFLIGSSVNQVDWDKWDEDRSQWDYDLTKYIVDFEGDPLKYWKQAGLYDTLTPIEGSEVCINTLKEYIDFVFITHCVGDHYRSKVDFLNKFFPDVPVIVTSSKGFVDVDVMIDDRLDFLDQFGDNTLKVLFPSEYKQNIEKKNNIRDEYKSWQDIQTMLTYMVSN